MEENLVDEGRYHKISCIFSDVDCMATKNTDSERSQAVIEKPDLVFHLNVVWSGVTDDRKLIIMNVNMEDD